MNIQSVGRSARVLVLVAGLALASDVFGATTYVNPGQSIQSAIDSAAPGTTIEVAAGTYYEAIDFRGKAITLHGAGSDRTTIDATNISSVSAVAFTNGETHAAHLDGFTIRGGKGTLRGGKRLGGGVYIRSAGPTITNCIIEGNSAQGGGGIGQVTGSAIIGRCTIRENVATESGDYGGAGLYAQFGTLTLHDCEILSNTSTNSASGGAATFEFTWVRAVNCLIADNQAGSWGGGVVNINGAVELVNCTIADNWAAYGGGGVYTKFSTSATSIINSVVWNNATGYSGPNIYDHGDGVHSTVLTSNIYMDAATGEYVATDPMFMDGPAGDYRLRSASPCINAGNEDELLNEDMLDLDGDNITDERVPDLDLQERVYVGWVTQVDMGAFEYQGDVDDEPDAEPCPWDMNGDSVINVFDLTSLLSAWGPCPANGPGDSDGNGVINVIDLLNLLAAWGVCPS